MDVMFCSFQAAGKFDFMVKFRLKVTQAVDINFELRVDFGKTGIQSLAKTVFGVRDEFTNETD